MKINDDLSDSRLIGCSVPQGSVLGPLLFLIFINDIPLPIKEHLSYSLLYADDLSCLFSYKSLVQERARRALNRKINAYLALLVAWLYKWRLVMNAKKCAYALFSKQPDDIRLNLSFNNELIPNNSNPFFMGITLDERLNFAKHFENLQCRAFKRINIIKIFCH